jgi:hypothetical protein
MPFPETADEAARLGYKLEEITSEEAKELMRGSLDNKFTAKVASRRNCDVLKEGEWCWRGLCDEHNMHWVLYCNGTKGCTVRAYVQCN